MLRGMQYRGARAPPHDSSSTSTSTMSSRAPGRGSRVSCLTTPGRPAAAGHATGRGTAAAAPRLAAPAAARRRAGLPHPPRASSPSASPQARPEHDAPAPRLEEPATALLLAWLAAGNRSLLAAQCLVEALVAAHREGRTFGELQLALRVAAQRAGPQGSGEGGAEGGEAEALPLLQGQAEEVLLSWIALVLLTLEELGVPRDRAPAPAPPPAPSAAPAPGAVPGASAAAPAGAADGAAGEGAASAYLRGMRGYVRQTLGLYGEGQTLGRVAGLQGLVQQSSGAGGPSPALLLMQQYTRLVLLAVEVVAAAGLPTTTPLRPPETVTQPSGYAGAFTAACGAAGRRAGEAEGQGEAGEGEGEEGVTSDDVCDPRGLALRLLLAFMGGVLGSGWSRAKFVEAVRLAYDMGMAADELFDQLEEAEFVQSGGVLPLGPNPPVPAAVPYDDAVPGGGGGGGGMEQHVTKALFSTWISLSYMTLAQLAVPYPGAGRRLGWAWAGFGDATEAIGMNDFVGNVLRGMAGQGPRTVDQLPPPPPPSGPQQPPGPPEADTADGEAGGEGAGGKEGAAADGRRPPVTVPMVRLPDSSLPNTSTAFIVLSQQVSLVQAMCMDVVAARDGDGGGPAV